MTESTPGVVNTPTHGQPKANPRAGRMRDSRYLTGEITGDPEETDYYGRRFTPQHFRATWERQGGSEWPWELRVTVQGASILKSGKRGEAIRSVVYEDEQRLPTDYTYRPIPEYLARELAPFHPDRDAWTAAGEPIGHTVETPVEAP